VTRYGMVMDVTSCNGCYNCFLACRDEHCGNDFPPYSASQPHTGHFWMRVVERERGRYPKVKVAYTAIPCLQCEEGTCLRVAQDGAIYKRGDGIVIIDPAKAVGQRHLVDTCPHRVIFWNEAKRIPQKCTFCAHLLDRGWKEPRCVEACPTGALVFGDLDDPESEVAQLVASGRTEALHPEYGLGDKVRYIGLPKRFIAGAVVYGDTDRCAEGAEVTLEGGGVTRVIRADNYGDFEFEGLARDQVYKVTIRAEGYDSREISATTNMDVYLGDIVLDALGAAVAAGAPGSGRHGAVAAPGGTGPCGAAGGEGGR
jgi:Fe-S-cluster-containing dehydrogenase component